MSSHPNKKYATDREKWFGGSFQLAGFKNGAPFYSNLDESHHIHYRKNRDWHMANSHDFKADNGSYYFRKITTGKSS